MPKPSLDPSRALEAAAAEIDREYPGEFASSPSGRLLSYAAGFALLAEPKLSESLRGDAAWLREQIYYQLGETLAVCVLSLQDVMVGLDSDDASPHPTPSAEQLAKMRESYYTRHFSDIVCDGDFWVIVDNIRADIDLDLGNE